LSHPNPLNCFKLMSHESYICNQPRQ
jgi:hypothetical protein